MDERSFPNAKLAHAFLIAYKAAADLAGKGAFFVITIVAARRLPPQAFGIFSLGVTLGWIAAVVSDFGIQLHLARAVATRPGDAARLLRRSLRVRLWTAALALAVIVIGLMSWGPRASAYSAPIALLALVYLCNGLIELLHYFYRGLSRSDVESTLTVWQRSATLVCAMLVLAWRPDVTRLAVAMLVPAGATLVASLRIAERMAHARSQGVRAAPDPAGPPDSGHDDGSRGFGREVWPIGAGIVLSALYFRIDVFLVQRWAGTEAVALYNAVFRLVEALRLFPAAVLAVALPSLCRAGDLRPVARVAAPVTVFALAASAALWLASGWLIPLVYGARYAGAATAFRTLLLAFPLLSLNFALTHQLVVWNGQRAYAAICALALVVNVALNARLIPAWSIDGAAWATLGTELFLTAACLLALWALVSRPAVEQAVMG